MYAIKLNDVSMAKLLLNYDYDIKEDKFNSVISGCLPSPEATQREDDEIKNYVKTSPVDLGHQVCTVSEAVSTCFTHEMRNDPRLL